MVIVSSSLSSIILNVYGLNSVTKQSGWIIKIKPNYMLAMIGLILVIR